MSDIVQELLFRSSDKEGVGWLPTTVVHVPAGLLHNAADEITRLRAEVERLKAIETEFWQQNSDLGKALLENEKLRAVLEAIANCQPKEDHNCNTNDLVACRVVNLARAALGDTP